jgi:predicted permease
MSDLDAADTIRTELADDAQLARVMRRRARRAPPPSSAALGRSAGTGWVAAFLHDLRYGVRSLRLRPGFTSAAVLTLALGIGANTAMFSVVRAVLLRPLPYPEPERLVLYWGTAPEKGLPEVAMPPGLFLYHRDRLRTFESLAGYERGSLTLTGDRDAERVDAGYVSADFFRVMGVAPELGRAFRRDEEAVNGGLVAILGHDLWQRRFGGDTTIIGRTIRINDLATTVVGVMPPGFEYPGRSRIWIPERLEATRFNCWCLSVIGRVRPGTTPDQARRDVERVTDEFGMARRDIFPDARPGGSRFVARTLAERTTGDVRPPLTVLLVAVALVLLIGCANIANLLLARSTQRVRELAVRCALGASPRRVATQLMTESLVLAAAGATAGLSLAAIGVRLLRGLPADQIPRIDQVALDPMAIAFTIGLATMTGLLFGLAPAIRATRVDLHDGVREGARGGTSGRARRLSDAFVVAQFACSLLLLTGAALLLRSFQRLMDIDPGYRTDQVLTARIAPSYQRYSSDTAVRLFYDQLLERARALPGVSAVGLASRIPLTPGNPQDNILAEGHEPRAGEPVLVANIRFVTPGYFDAIGTRVRSGRVFDASDGPTSARVVIVDESLVNRYWPNGDPIGKRVRHGGEAARNPWMTIVGVVPNIKHSRLNEDPSLQVYEPLAQQAVWSPYVVMRSSVDATDLIPGLRAAVAGLDRGVPLFEVRTMEQAMASSLGTRTLLNRLLLGFAMTALLLSAIGLYGVISLNVNARRREFGVRLALGAQARSVLGLVLRHGLSLAGIGVAAGLAGAWWATPLLRDLLVGVGPFDPVTFASAAAILTGIAVGACLIPARRATRADPTEALRAE